MLARVVRAEERFGFCAGGVEEEELELVAYVSLCDHARRYDASLHTHGTPDNHFQGWAQLGIYKECVRAAEKIRAKGLCGLPQPDRLKPRCSASSDEQLSRLSWSPERDEFEDRVLLGGKHSTPVFRTRLARRLWRIFLKIDPCWDKESEPAGGGVDEPLVIGSESYTLPAEKAKCPASRRLWLLLQKTTRR